MNQATERNQTGTLLLLAGALFSGICWFLSFNLTGKFGMLLWIAPIPVLYNSLLTSSRNAFWTSFAAYLLGWLSWTSYLLSVLPFLPVVLLTVSIPSIFALVVWIFRKIVLKYNRWWTVFAFPVFWTFFEFLLIRISSDGTFGSVAYTQSNFLPVIQVASLTGLPGITFMTTLLPSAIAVGLHLRKNNRQVLRLTFVTFLFLVVTLTYGFVRLKNYTPSAEIRIGMAVGLEKIHNETGAPDRKKELAIAAMYSHYIGDLTGKGAKVILLPEKIISATPDVDSAMSSMFSTFAKKFNCTIIVGYTRIDGSTKRNKAVVFSPDGGKLADYTKVNLFEGERYNRFVPGKDIATFNLTGIQSGLVICKDMDFDRFLRKYSAVGNAAIVYAPAWDFVKDDWLHSRMAILRGVENGFAVVRNARLGRLTISDNCGRVLHEASSVNGEPVFLLGNAEISRSKTLFSLWGDWFGIINVFAAILFVVLLFLRIAKSTI